MLASAIRDLKALTDEPITEPETIASDIRITNTEVINAARARKQRLG